MPPSGAGSDDDGLRRFDDVVARLEPRQASLADLRAGGEMATVPQSR
jgi:hypothetical protein